MASKSAITHEFRREKVAGDGSCLYTSFRWVNGTLKSMDNKRLRSMVADRIWKNEKLHLTVLQSGTQYKTVKDYCLAVEKRNLWGGEAEIRALVLLSNLLIRLVSKTKTAQGQYAVNILNYGEDIGSIKECIYILYDEEHKHYDPLYVIDKRTKDKQTIFQCDDSSIDEILIKFIHEELHVLDDKFIQFEPDIDASTEIESVDDSVSMVFDLIQLNAHENNPVKRKLPNHVELSFANAVDPALLSSSSHAKVINDQPIEMTEWNSDENCVKKLGNQSINIEQHLQTNFFHDIETIVQQSIIENENYEEERMKFAVEPALHFRGRTRSEYKPKKPLKRNGQQATSNKPRHFADRNGKNVLNLLIPEKCLSPHCEYKLEVSMITPEINGCSYVNSYFKFQVDPTDKNVLDVNPLEIPLDINELKDYTEGIKEYPLRLVVVMDTNPDLMKTNQPLEIFSASKNGSPISEIYTKHREFKKAYRLNELRFAVTLLEKHPGEKCFRRCDHVQYTSQISTQQGAYERSKN